MKLIRRGTRPTLAKWAIYQGWNVWLVDDECPGVPPDVAERNSIRIPHEGRWVLPDVPAGTVAIFMDDDGNLSLNGDEEPDP